MRKYKGKRDCTIIKASKGGFGFWIKLYPKKINGGLEVIMG
jgi:hypothetical protein